MIIIGANKSDITFERFKKFKKQKNLGQEHLKPADLLIIIIVKIKLIAEQICALCQSQL